MNTDSLRRVPVLAFKEHHFESDYMKETREMVGEVMEKYLSADEVWGRRETAWLLAHDTIFDAEGIVLDVNLCRMWVKILLKLGPTSLISLLS